MSLGTGGGVQSLCISSDAPVEGEGACGCDEEEPVGAWSAAFLLQSDKNSITGWQRIDSEGEQHPVCIVRWTLASDLQVQRSLYLGLCVLPTLLVCYLL